MEAGKQRKRRAFAARTSNFYYAYSISPNMSSSLPAGGLKKKKEKKEWQMNCRSERPGKK